MTTASETDPKPLAKEQRAVQVDAWMCAECQELYESAQEAYDCYLDDWEITE